MHVDVLNLTPGEYKTIQNVLYNYWARCVSPHGPDSDPDMRFTDLKISATIKPPKEAK